MVSTEKSVMIGVAVLAIIFDAPCEIVVVTE
jgi:hypothetical protein